MNYINRIIDLSLIKKSTASSKNVLFDALKVNSCGKCQVNYDYAPPFEIDNSSLWFIRLLLKAPVYPIREFVICIASPTLYYYKTKNQTFKTKSFTKQTYNNNK